MTNDLKLSGPKLKAAMDAAGMSIKDVAGLFDVSLKTVYNLVKTDEIRGPYRLAAQYAFPSLRPVVSQETE